MRKITAYKHKRLKHHLPSMTNAPVFYAVVSSEDVSTPDGVMKLVELNNNFDLTDAANDLIARVGRVAAFYENSDKVQSMTYDLLYWNDKFWICAINGNGVPYRRNKHDLLYEVTIDNPEGLLGKLNV